MLRGLPCSTFARSLLVGLRLSFLGFDNGFDSSGFLLPISFELSFNSVSKSISVVPMSISPTLKCWKMVVLSKLGAIVSAPISGDIDAALSSVLRHDFH